MGILDGFLQKPDALGQLAPLGQLVASNRPAVKAALALLNRADASVGGTGGLAGLQSFQEKAWVT